MNRFDILIVWILKKRGYHSIILSENIMIANCRVFFNRTADKEKHYIKTKNRLIMIGCTFFANPPMDGAPINIGTEGEK